MIRGRFKVLILMSSILAVGCNRDSGIDYTQPFDPNIIELSNLTYKGIPFKGQVSSLDRLGRPDTTWTQQEILRYPIGSDSLATEERMVEVRCYDQQLYLHVLPDSSYLVQEVYFRDQAMQVEYSEAIFSANTALAEMKEIFPKSYTHLQRIADASSKELIEERLILGTTEENRDGTLRPLYVSFEAGKLVSLLLI